MAFLFRLIKIVFLIAVFVVCLVFAINNAGMITVNVLTYEYTAPRILVFALFLVLGVIMGLLVMTGPLFRQRRQIQQLKRDMRLQEQIAANAKAKPEDLSIVAMPPV